MNGLHLLILLGLAAVASAAHSHERMNDEQHGRFFLYKLKPKDNKEAELLLRSNTQYGINPPIFIQNVRVGESVLVLVEESKVSVWERFLKTHRIQTTKKGLTLIDSITARTPTSGRLGKAVTCDCDYHNGGCIISIPPPEGYACKCVYKGFWSCSGYPFSCDANMRCPANCGTRECCLTGRGDCGGY